MTENGKRWVVCKTQLFEGQGVFMNHKYQVDWNNYFSNVYVMGNYIPKKYFELHTDSDIKYQDWLNTPAHYDNKNGTLYKVALERGWNPYLFDIVKRLERSEKKGEFDSDLDKSINVIKLWKTERNGEI